jgi:hypothetical protein
MSQQAEAARPKQRLTTPQTLHLMRLEVDRALKHGYPISCLMLGLDGFVDSDTMLLRRQVMPLVFHELKTETFEREVRGLGVWTEGFQLAVFPHVTPQEIQELADGLLARARDVSHAALPEGTEITLSIGIAHNLHPGEVTFETLVQDAESGMGMAQASGGDRVSGFREVETELDRLKSELDEQLKEIADIQAKVFADGETEDEAWGKALVLKVLEVFDREPDQNEGVVRLQKEVVALLKHELAEFNRSTSAMQLIEAQSTIEQLERRVNKLTSSLGRTEEELKRVAAMKDIDVGVASIYRTVQGLSSADDQFEAKKEMLKNIFEANVALRAEMTSKE